MRYIFLDYLRIFACLCVFTAHKFVPAIEELLNNPGMHATPRFILQSFVTIFLGGGVGVMLFFLISGYIMAHMFYKNTSTSFLIKRVFRIYPLYIFAVLLQYSILKMQNPDYEIVLSHLITQLLLIGDFFNTPYALAGVEWTLRIEILFYIFLALLRKFKPNGLSSPWFLPVISIVVIVFAALPPIPYATNGEFVFNNYLLFYSPFLFMGISFYLFQTQKINFYIFTLFILLVFSLYWYNISQYQPATMGVDSHFAVVGFCNLCAGLDI